MTIFIIYVNSKYLLSVSNFNLLQQELTLNNFIIINTTCNGLIADKSAKQ